MGIGGALIMPATLSILTNVFRDPRERGRAIAVWAGFSGLGVAHRPGDRRPAARALLVELGVLGQPADRRHRPRSPAYFLVPTSRDPNQGKLDPLGAVLSIVGLGVAAVRHHRGPGEGLDRPARGRRLRRRRRRHRRRSSLWELHTPTPMLDMRFFQNPRFTAANSAITLTFFAMFGSMFLMTQYWQFVHGYSPLGAGVRMIPFALTMMVVAPLSARLVERVGTKRVVTTGLLDRRHGPGVAVVHRAATTPYPLVDHACSA